MTRDELNTLQKAGVTLRDLAEYIKDDDKGHKETIALSKSVMDAVNEIYRLNGVTSRINDAIQELSNMIDGGEECRGRDSAISLIIAILDGTIKL